MNDLSVREGYRLWAPVYGAETAVSMLDERLTTALSPPITGVRLLDAGCGIGRRIPRNRAAFAVGTDLCLEMLEAGSRTCAAVADIRALPFADAQFDVIWCRLVLGHLAMLAPAFSEMARVCRAGGCLLVTDFHWNAVSRGHRRSFRDTSGELHSIEHHVHDCWAYISGAANSGFDLVEQRDGVVGPAIETFYHDSGRIDAYRRDIGLALVAAFLFRRQ